MGLVFPTGHGRESGMGTPGDVMNTMGTAARRLTETVRYTAGIDLPAVEDIMLLEPDRLRGLLEVALAGTGGRVRVAGTLDRRLACIERPDRQWVVADLSGQPHQTRPWPICASGQLELENPGSWLSLATIDRQAAYRLSRPSVLLVALYHPEYFPLPRFPLAISDVARAARSTLLGMVRLADMQLGVTLDDLVQRVRAENPDILGISATFGQHDLMIRLLDAAYGLT